METIKERLDIVLEKINMASFAANRDPAQIKLTVVTKGQNIESINEAYNAGVRIFGENYLEEAKGKIISLRFSDAAWHMIGHVQSRKAKDVAAYFNMCQSLDSVKLAERLNRFLREINKILPVLLEVNAAGEITKGGWDISDQKQWGGVAEEFEKISGLTNLRTEGLMTMPPLEVHADEARKHFHHVGLFRDYIRKELPNIGMKELSMGTSADFESAIMEGATIIRLGTIIMGPRNYNRI